MIRTWLLGVSLAAFAAPLALAQDSGARQARIVQSSGTVYIHLQGQPEDSFIAAEPDASLSPGDLVRTGDDGSCEIGLDGDSVIELGPGTDFIVTSLDPKATEFHLGLGTLVAKFRSLFQNEAMTIRTSNAVAAVRGTELGVQSASDDEPTHVGVFDEGKVAVQSEGAAGEVQLGPGQETSAKSGAPPAAAGPLKALSAHRQVLVMARQNAVSLKRTWVRRTPAQFDASRRRLSQKRRFRASELSHMSPERRARRYQKIQQHRQKLERQYQRRGQLQRRQDRQEAQRQNRQAWKERRQQRQERRQEKIQENRQERQEKGESRAQRRKKRQKDKNQ